jgi:predicted nucleotidyltransferase component of viral defense system
MLSYPRALSDIRGWSRQNGMSVNEARLRFAQYGILRAIASSRALSGMLVFKGGNALDFVWEPNRSTKDLDFSADMSTIDSSWNLDRLGEFLKTSLEPALRGVTAELGTVFAIHSVDRQPRGDDKHFVTYEIRVGYAHSDQAGLLRRMAENLPSTDVIPIEISLNESICASDSVDIQASNDLRVSTLDDIVAEKLRSLLQQPIRNRRRRQDLLDIAVILGESPSLDGDLIADYLQRKCVEREIVVSRSAFRHPEIAARAQHQYDLLKSTTRNAFVPFEEAIKRLYSFTDTLPISE